MENPYQKLGKRLSNFAIIVLVYGLINEVDSLLVNLGVPIASTVSVVGTPLEIDPLSIVGFIFLVIAFILQILVIILARKAGNQYSKPALSQFATYMVLYLVISIASNFMAVIAVLFLPSTPGTYSIMGFTLTGAIAKVCAVMLQFLAWLSMFKAFGTVEAVDIRARSVPWTRFVVIAFTIYLSVAIAIGISQAIMDSSITVYPDNTISSFSSDLSSSLGAIGSACMIAVYVIACPAYFKFGAIFVSLGAVEAPPAAPQPVSNAFPGTTSFSRDVTGPSTPASPREGLATCSFCGARFPVDESMQFCPNCGARFRKSF